MPPGAAVGPLPAGDDPRRRRRASLRWQLLAVLLALCLPLLVVAPLGLALVRTGDQGHLRSTQGIDDARRISDLQARVAVLTSSLTEIELLDGDPVALVSMLVQGRAVEQGFVDLLPRLRGPERAGMVAAYDGWQGMSRTLLVLPARFPVLRTDVHQLRVTLDDVGTRLLALAQVLDSTATENARQLQAQLDTDHRRQQAWVLCVVGTAVLGLGASVLAARWLHRRIARPLVALQRAAERLGRDDLEHRAEPDPTPEFAALAGAFNTMADRLRDSRALLTRREARFRALVQHSSDVVAIIDVSAVVTYVTPSVQAMLGLCPDSVVGTRLLDRVHPDDRQLVAAVVDAALVTHEVGDTVPCRLATAGGGWCRTELVVVDLSADPAVGGLVVTVHDVTEAALLHDQLAHKAFHDELTGLANRVLFTDRLAHALTGRDQRPPAVLCCDLDDFKTVNDTLGHVAGDALLVAVAERLSGALRSRDTAARFGGDEFAVLLEDVTAEQALETAARVLAAVGQGLVVEGVEIFPRMSIGISVAPVAGGADELLRQADAALYQAKYRGKNDVVLFDADLADDLLARLELKSDLQRALQHGEFHLCYQPTVELATGVLTGVEALVRWAHPTRGAVPPVDFVPLAEETGLIVKLGLWVLETACAQMHAWRQEFPEQRLHLNVNLSGRQLEDDEIVDDVRSVLALTGLDPSALTLELTESVLLDRSDQVLDRLHRLRALGLQLAIDDFGTGYSSLNYLQRLPVDVLKIDKSFVDALVGAPGGSGEALAATIVQLARTLGLTSVAEGIEHASQAEALRLLGCDTGQGFLFARPLPPAALRELLAGAAAPAPAVADR